MNGRNQAEQGLHDTYVRLLAKHFSSLGYTGIRADIADYPQTPSGIFWKENPEQKYIPDVTCYKNDANKTIIIAEVETEGSLTSDHTKEQWKLFAAHAHLRNGQFHVMLPKNCANIAEALEKEIGITVDKYWWPVE